MNNTKFEYLDHLTTEMPIIFHDNKLNSRGILSPHWHPNVEILLITSGTGVCTIGSETFEIKPLDIVVVNASFLHTIKCHQPLTYYCLIVDTEFCIQNDIPTEQLRYESLVSSDKAVALYQNIIAEISSDSAFRKAGILSAVLNFMLYLSRNHLDYINQHQKAAVNENIKLAIGYIKSHIDQKLTLDQIAAEVGLSKYYFVREFKNITSMTPVAYINAARCENAVKLLLKRKYNVHEIAQKCGFTNDSYFSKVFREHTGLLPSEYVKEQDTVIHEQY